ncbi:8097_t:CDS:2 [Racocetra persica]|uniref:8097_t:CDS:1 n=1 Tax=Racocetra persica TaxID=160502 RepID=A0ACA9PDC2_9GLOM|nr:8097_t:CDS:2 [Racocetra persica]
MCSMCTTSNFTNNFGLLFSPKVSWRKVVLSVGHTSMCLGLFFLLESSQW